MKFFSIKNIYFTLTVLSIFATKVHTTGNYFSSFIEHSNIKYQKEHDLYWNTLFKTEMLDSPIDLADRFKNALKENTFLAQYNQHFYLGLSSSAYQFEGGIGEESSWHRFALKKGHALPGKASNFWLNYKIMIKQMKEEFGINSFRLSISWERIQKERNTFDQDALKHYKNIIKELKKYGIEPIVVLHHYTVPTWFEDLGGFEKEENIPHFVNFALKVYQELADQVTFWSTFNAIEGYAFKGYYTLDGAPGKEKSMQLTAQVMCNMLKAHVAIYTGIKGHPYTHAQGKWEELIKNHPEVQFPNPQIGIQKNIIFLDIAYDNIMHYLLAPTTWALCCMGNILQNEGFYNFFNTGSYKIYIPGMVNIQYIDAIAPLTLDWIGVNHYANQKRFLMSVVQENDLMSTTCNPNYRYYPHGLYRAVKEIHNRINGRWRHSGGIRPYKGKQFPYRNSFSFARNIPILITENGIAAHTEAQRTDFFKKTLFIVTKLLEEQLPLIGYTPWAAFDNYEWGSKALGEKRYGMFYVNFNNTEEKPTLKEGSKFFASFTKKVTS